MTKVSVSADELQRRFQTKSLFNRRTYLTKKGEPKPYSDQNRSAYQFNFVGIGLSHIARVAAGFMAVYFFLRGVFSAFGSTGDFIAGLVAITILLMLEIRQWKNTTQFWETWFFRSHMDKSRLGWAVFFSAITLIMSLVGLPHSVSYIGGQVNHQTAGLIDVKAATDDLRAAVVNANDAAEKFRKSGTWQGRLSDADRRTYKKLLEDATTAQTRLDTKTSELEAENRQRTETTRLANEAAIQAKIDQDASYTWILGAILLLTEALFWFCFYHKERYEFLEAMEMKLAAHVPTGSTPPSTGRDVDTAIEKVLRKAERTRADNPTFTPTLDDFSKEVKKALAMNGEYEGSAWGKA